MTLWNFFTVFIFVMIPFLLGHFYKKFPLKIININNFTNLFFLHFLNTMTFLNMRFNFFNRTSDAASSAAVVLDRLRNFIFSNVNCFDVRSFIFFCRNIFYLTVIFLNYIMGTQMLFHQKTRIARGWADFTIVSKNFLFLATIVISKDITDEFNGIINWKVTDDFFKFCFV